MSRSVLADMGPLYAAVDPDDQHHTRSQEQLNDLATQGMSVVIAYPILSEAYSLILYRMGFASASNWIDDMRAGSAWVNPSPQDYRDAPRYWSLAIPISPSRCSMPLSPPWRHA